MKASELKGLMTRCPDRTDLPTPCMVEAGLRAHLETWGDDTKGMADVVTEIWNAMLDALREEGNPPQEEARP